MVQVMAMVPQLAQAALCEASVRTDLPFCAAETATATATAAAAAEGTECSHGQKYGTLYIRHIQLYIYIIYTCTTYALKLFTILPV